MEPRAGKKWFPGEARRVGWPGMRRGVGWLLLGVFWALELAGAEPAPVGFAPPTGNRFRVMTYNVENYLLAATATRPAKSAQSRAKVAESIVRGRPDVLALQEMGSLEALHELQTSLKQHGLDLPHLDYVRGWDTNIFVAVLSRFPFLRRNPHSNESFLLNGRRWHMSRGIVEVDLAVSSRYQFTLFTTHLKSRRVLAEASEREVREHEAIVLRELVEARMARDPEANILVCGDFNDTRDTPTLKTLIGERGPRLFDPRPAEANGDAARPENPKFEPRRVTWTHYFGKEDSYSRIDYLLLTRGLRREWYPEGSQIVVVPDWGLGSDHRPVVCEFYGENR